MLLVPVSLRWRQGLSGPKMQALDDCLIRRWKQINSSVHALGFRCDSHYFDAWTTIQSCVGFSFVSLECDCSEEQCLQALKQLSASDAYYDTLLTQSYVGTCEPDSVQTDLLKLQTEFLREKMNINYMELADVSVKLYRSPASSATVDRNQRTAAAVLTETRCRLGNLTL